MSKPQINFSNVALIFFCGHASCCLSIFKSAHLFATQLPFHLESLAPSPPSDGLIISSAKVELIGVHSLPHPDLQPFSSSQLHHCQYPGSIRTASYMHPTRPKNTLMVQWGRIAKVSYFLLHHAHANSLDFCPLIEIKMILLST